MRKKIETNGYQIQPVASTYQSIVISLDWSVKLTFRNIYGLRTRIDRPTDLHGGSKSVAMAIVTVTFWRPSHAPSMVNLTLDLPYHNAYSSAAWPTLSSPNHIASTARQAPAVAAVATAAAIVVQRFEIKKIFTDMSVRGGSAARYKPTPGKIRYINNSFSFELHLSCNDSFSLLQQLCNDHAVKYSNLTFIFAQLENAVNAHSPSKLKTTSCLSAYTHLPPCHPQGQILHLQKQYIFQWRTSNHLLSSLDIYINIYIYIIYIYMYIYIIYIINIYVSI